jgi:hypothetical protein
LAREGTSEGKPIGSGLAIKQIPTKNLAMARPLRIEFPGGLYHVTTRGDRREAIYLSDADRQYWLDLLGNVCTKHNWLCHAYCLMDNHFHIVGGDHRWSPERRYAPAQRRLHPVA